MLNVSIKPPRKAESRDVSLPFTFIAPTIACFNRLMQHILIKLAKRGGLLRPAKRSRKAKTKRSARSQQSLHSWGLYPGVCMCVFFLRLHSRPTTERRHIYQRHTTTTTTTAVPFRLRIRLVEDNDNEAEAGGLCMAARMAPPRAPTTC